MSFNKSVCLIYDIVHCVCVSLVIVPYYPFNICKLFSDVTSFIPDISNLCSFSFFFLMSLAKRFISFIDLFETVCFDSIDFSFF